MEFKQANSTLTKVQNIRLFYDRSIWTVSLISILIKISFPLGNHFERKLSPVINHTAEIVQVSRAIKAPNKCCRKVTPVASSFDSKCYLQAHIRSLELSLNEPKPLTPRGIQGIQEGSFKLGQSFVAKSPNYNSYFTCCGRASVQY